MSEAQRFRVAPVTFASLARFQRAFPIGWVVLPVPFLLIGLGGAGLLLPGMRMPWGISAVLLAGGLLLPALMGLSVLFTRSAFLEIEGVRLVTKGAPNAPSARLDSLRLREARIINLALDRGFVPTSGVGLNLPGYSAGLGSISRGEKVAWLITDPQGVVYIPARTGYSLLISVQSPEIVIEALRSWPMAVDVSVASG
jgi:hypothetical protein